MTPKRIVVVGILLTGFLGTAALLAHAAVTINIPDCRQYQAMAGTVRVFDCVASGPTPRPGTTPTPRPPLDVCPLGTSKRMDSTVPRGYHCDCSPGFRWSVEGCGEGTAAFGPCTCIAGGTPVPVHTPTPRPAQTQTPPPWMPPQTPTPRPTVAPLPTPLPVGPCVMLNRAIGTYLYGINGVMLPQGGALSFCFDLTRPVSKLAAVTQDQTSTGCGWWRTTFVRPNGQVGTVDGHGIAVAFTQAQAGRYAISIQDLSPACADRLRVAVQVTP